MRVAVMQGRLTPPIDGRFQCFPVGVWAREFDRAATAGLDCIEWIYDAFGADENPIASETGIASIREASLTHGIGVVSVCADYFMDRPLLNGDEAERDARYARLVWLIGQCKSLGVERIVVPFVDASAISGDAEFQFAVDVLTFASVPARDAAVELHLETSLGPQAFADLLAALPADVVKVNYDIGNSASLGYDPRDEFEAYGPRVGSIHIKDRVRGGGTVPLGTGDADFGAVFHALGDIGYRGDFVMQIARGVSGDETAWIAANRERIEGWISPLRSSRP